MVQGDLWKRWLIRDLRDLRDEMEGRNWAESESFRAAVVERFMFVTAYVSRKLLEGEELTIDLIEHAWPVKRYRCVRHPPARQQFRVSRDLKSWWQPIEDHYDLANPQNGSLRLPKLCNSVIHHFAFEVRSADAETIEIYFNSDYTKNDVLNMIPLTTYLEFVDEVAHDQAAFSPSIARQIDRSATARGASICSSSTFWLGRSVGGECGMAALLLLPHCDSEATLGNGARSSTTFERLEGRWAHARFRQRCGGLDGGGHGLRQHRGLAEPLASG